MHEEFEDANSARGQLERTLDAGAGTLSFWGRVGVGREELELMYYYKN